MPRPNRPQVKVKNVLRSTEEEGKSARGRDLWEIAERCCLVHRGDLVGWLMSGLAEQRRIDRALVQGDSGHAAVEKSIVVPMGETAESDNIIILHRPDDEKKNKRHHKVRMRARREFNGRLTARDRPSTLTRSKIFAPPPRSRAFPSSVSRSRRTTSPRSR